MTYLEVVYMALETRKDNEDGGIKGNRKEELDAQVGSFDWC